MKEDKFFYKICKCIYKALLKILFRPMVYGKENIPNEGAVIFAGNHKCALDPVVVMSNTKRIVHFIAKEEVSSGIRKPVFKRLGVIIINKDVSKNIKAMKDASNVLKSKGALGIFPEGTRNRTDKELLELKDGTCTLAIKYKSKIIPFAIRGRYKAFRKSLEIEFGKPIDVSNLNIKDADELLRNKIIELLRK